MCAAGRVVDLLTSVTASFRSSNERGNEALRDFLEGLVFYDRLHGGRRSCDTARGHAWTGQNRPCFERLDTPTPTIMRSVRSNRTGVRIIPFSA